MPGTLPLADAEQSYADRLRQHAQSVWDTISSAPQQAVSTLQAVSPQVQELATPVTSAAPDPSAIIASLQQHAQDAWQQVQNAPQQVVQAVQPTAQAVDPTAITQRLMQHAQDAFQSVDQNAQPIGQGLQQAQPTLPPGQTGVPGVDPRLSGGVQPPTRVTNAAGESTIVSPPSSRAAGDMPNVQVDSSSPDAFIRSVTPAAQWVQQQTGIPAEAIIGMAANETGYGKAAPGNNLFGIKGKGPAGSTTSGTWEDYGQGPVNITDQFRRYDNATQSFQDFVQFLRDNPRYGTVMGLVDSGKATTQSFVQGLKDAGYMTDPNYVGKIQGIVNTYQPIIDQAKSAVGQVGQIAGTAVDAAKQTVGGVAQGVLPAVSQFGDKQLTAAEAYAACGPAAAVRFAQMYGRNPSLREATDLAKGVGWTSDTGMAGLQSESKLFDQMGIPHRVVGADWKALQREAQSGNPVTISTYGRNGGHYFTADSYDPNSGAFHVGSSGTDLVGGSEWMTPAQMEAKMGALQGGLAADNPGTPAPSPISQNPHPLPGRPGGLVTPPGTYNPPPGSLAISLGLQNVDAAVQSAVSGTTEAVGGAAGAVGAAAGAAITRARSAAEEAAAAVEPTVKNAADLVNQAPLPFGAGKVSDVTTPAADLMGKVQTPDETTPLPGRVAGTGLSALGTVVKAATDELDRLSVASAASREAAGEDVYAQKYATAGGPQLEDEYRSLLAKRMGGDDTVGTRMTEIAGQLQQINDTIRAGRPVSEVQQRLSEENPLTPVSTTLTNLGAMVLAAPLAAGEAPLVARALAEIIQPGTNPVALARAIRVVEDAKVPASQLVQAIDQVRKMPGTAELAPVRQQVTQSSTDLLQAMLDAAKAKGVAPEKLEALQQQIATMDPAAAARRVLGSRQRGEVDLGLLTTGKPTPRGGFTAPEVPSTRMYHGTGADFPNVDPARVAGEENLFGPGYYLTSHPDVAGGVVQRTTEPLTPIQQSLVDRGLLRPENARSQAGAVLSPGYAQHRGGGGVIPSVFDQLEGAERTLAMEQTFLERARTAGNAEQVAARTGSVDRAQAEVDALRTQSRTAAGPNVRAVDVPGNLRLINADAPPPEDVKAILQADYDRRLPNHQTTGALTGPASMATDDTFANLYKTAERLGYGSPSSMNRALAQAGYDGITYNGGKRIPMTDAAGEPIEHQATVIFSDSLDKVRNAVSGRQGGFASARFAADIGSAAAGGYAGYETTPEDASPLERGLRTAGGAAAGLGLAHTAVGLAGFRGSVDKTIMENLRNAGISTAAPKPAQPLRGFIPEAVEQTKQMLLTGPTTHIGNVIGGTIELGRLPVALAMGGRADDALASLLSVGKAFPQAAGNALSLLGGLEPANLSRGASLVPRRYPIYRALSAADAFVRTLGEYQGMSAKANQLLRDAGMTPSDPGVANFLATHSADIFDAGKGIGQQTVFGQAGTTATASNGLERAFRAYSTFKEGMLNSPDKKSQALGALLDYEIPFSGVPVRMLSLAGARTPPGTQIRGAVRAAQAIRRGDLPGAQQAIGETAMETTIQLLIAKNIADGNIRGPDDPDHPLGVHMPGLGWIDTKEWGAYALPMQIMAAFAEGYEKGGQNIPGLPKDRQGTLDEYDNYYGPRFDAALRASMKPFVQAVPGMNLIRTLSTMSQGDLTATGFKVASDVINRMAVPGAARFVENLTDPVARDVAKKGVKSIYEPAFAGLPGLAELLPEKIDPTTGEVAGKRRAGPGILIGQQQDVASPLTVEAERLNQMGYSVTAPKTYPSSVTIAGSQVDLKPDEQRAVAKITGARLATLGARIDAPAYQDLPNTDAGNNKRQAMLKAIINAADVARVNAAQQVLGKDELRRRIAANRQIGGRLVDQAAAPDDFAFFNPTGENILTQRALAGSRA